MPSLQPLRKWLEGQKVKSVRVWLVGLKAKLSLRHYAVALIVVAAALVVLLLFRWANGDPKTERINVITGLAQVIGGTALLGGLYFTAQNVKNSAKAVEVSAKTLKVSQQTLDNSRTTLQLERRSKESERFFKSIEMLSDDSMYARVGALYALGSLAKESEADRDQSYDVIVSFLRTTTQGLMQMDSEPPKPDVQAAVDVLADREPDSKSGVLRRMDFTDLTLKNVKFRGGCFDRCLFQFAQLQGSDFTNCKIRHSNFSLSSCIRCRFGETDLSGTYFIETKLNDAFFMYTKTRMSSVDKDTRLNYVLLRDAELSGATFIGANLSEVEGLTQSMMVNVSVEKGTILPPGIKVENQTL